MALPTMPKEERVDFVVKMVSILVEQGCSRLPEAEKKSFLEKVVQSVSA